MGTLLATGIESAPVLSARIKGAKTGQFTVKFAEMFSDGGTQPKQGARAVSIRAEGQVMPTADSIMGSHHQGSVESFGKDMKAQGEGNVPASKANTQCASSPDLPEFDGVEKSGTIVPSVAGSETQVDSSPSSPASKESDGGETKESPEPIAQPKNGKQGACLEKSDLKSHKSKDEAKAAKKESGKEQHLNAQNGAQMVVPHSVPSDNIQPSCFASTAERSNPNLGNVEVAVSGHTEEKSLKTTLVTTSAKSLNTREPKDSSRRAPASNAGKEHSESSAGKAPVEGGRLSSQSNDVALETKKAANAVGSGITIAHRPEQMVVTSSFTMQPQTGSALSHRGPGTGDSSISEKSRPAAFVANGTTANEQPHVLKATANTLEVGLAGGPHGWVKVRAEMSNDGRVSASLSSSSLTGQQMLRHELPSLTTFLKGENVQVRSLTVQSPTSTGERNSLQGGASTSPDRGHQQQGSGQSGEQLSGSSSNLSAKGMGLSMSGADTAAERMGDDWTYMTGGNWLSVMA